MSGRGPSLSDRQADIIRLINPQIGARAIADELGVDHRLIRAVRNRTGVYATPNLKAVDNQVVEYHILRRYPSSVMLWEQNKYG